MRTRLMMGTAALAGCTTVLLCFILFQVRAAGEQSTSLDGVRELTLSLKDVNHASHVFWHGVARAGLSGDEQDAAAITATHEERLTRIRALAQLADEHAEPDVAEAARAVEGAIEAIGPSLAEATGSEVRPTLERLVAAEVERGPDSVEAREAVLASLIDERGRASAARTGRAADRAVLGVVLGGGATIAAILLAAWAASTMISRRLRAVTEDLGGAGDQLDALAAGLHATAEANAERSEVVAGAASVVGASVREVAVSVEQLGFAIEEIARTAASARAVAAQAVGEAAGTNESVDRLGRSTAEIGEVVQLIAAVAEQTNLLALNATIEAARAGEMGKGFAVVAAEVKELATQTSAATAEIGGRIATIQTDSREAVDAISRIVATVDEVAQLQHTIAAAVEEQSASVSEVARSMEHASASTDQIISSIEDVAANSRNNSEAVDRLHDAIGGLAGTTGALDRLLGAKAA